MANHVQSLPLDEAHRRFQQAQSTIQELEKIVAQEESKPKPSKQPAREPTTAPPPTRQEPRKLAPRPACITLDPAWGGTIEEMVNLDSYQITLKPLSSSPSDHNITDVRLEREPNDTTLALVGDILSWKLPVIVHDYTLVQLKDCLSIRLQCSPDAFLDSEYCPTTPRIDKLECNSCQTTLLSEPIARVVPLPNGYWDEISDYLICYPGEPAVNFGSALVPLESAWEDASAFVLHPDSLGTCVTMLQSVDPYGTHSSSASSWQPEGRQVETLCCSYCCSPVGIATNQGYHLYKHRLLGSSSSGTVPIFIANELKRYAESQAIFTFVVTMSSTKKCLLLHVVSWDSKIINAATGAGTKKRVVKVIYEESSQLPHQEEDDLTSWSWGGLDLCCDPSSDVATTTNKQKSVILTLEDDEWTDLIQSIRSSQYYFPQEVVNATILIKLGKLSNEAGLAAMDLY